MPYSSNEVKAGVIVLAGFGLLLLFLIAIFGIEFEENVKTYETHLQNVPGIVKGSLVKFGGMDVGEVTEVELPTAGDPKAMIGLKLKVDARTPVKENSVAFVTSVGIMADQHIEIAPGSLDSPFLPDGGTLQSKEVLSFMQMAEPFGDMSEKMETLIDRVSDLLNDENRGEIAQLLKNINGMVADGSDQMLVLMENLNTLTANLAQVSNELNDLMKGNRETFDGTVANLEATTRETAQLVSDLRTFMVQFENIVSTSGSNIGEIMENFQFASQNLEEFTRMVKERPWLLVRKSGPPKRKLP